MTPEAVGTLIGACVAFLALIGSVLALIFQMGTIKGQITTFMTTAERDRADMLKDVGRLEERFERHVEAHDPGHRRQTP